MRRLLAAATLAALTASPALALKLYTTEDDAKAHCKSEVVWLNAKRMSYRLPGMPGYGTTKIGAYVCKRAAIHAGAHLFKPKQ